MPREQRPMILIIDNDDRVTRALAARLGHAGYDCITAATGRQGLAAFGENAVDLVISDLNMPAGDGVALANAIRESSDVPILFVTGFAREFRSALRTVEGYTILRKPFDSQDLLGLVEVELALAECAAPRTACDSALERT